MRWYSNMSGNGGFFTKNERTNEIQRRDRADGRRTDIGLRVHEAPHPQDSVLRVASGQTVAETRFGPDACPNAPRKKRKQRRHRRESPERSCERRAFPPSSDPFPPPVQCGDSCALCAMIIIRLRPHMAGLRPAGSHCEKSGKSDDTCASARSDRAQTA